MRLKFLPKIKKNDFKGSLSHIHELITSVLFFALPFPDKLLPIIMMLWVLSWLSCRVLGTTITNHLLPSHRKGLILLLVWLAWSSFSVFFTNNPSSGTRVIETRILLVLVPIILLVGEITMSKEKLIRAYFNGALVALGVYYFSISLQYLVLDNINLRFQFNLPQLLFYFSEYKHPAYLSLNLIIAFYLYVQNINFSRRWGGLLIVYVLFGATIFLIQSRMGLIGFALMTSVLFMQYIKRKYDRKWFFVSLIPCVLLFMLVVKVQPKFGKIISVEDENITIVATRDILWQSAISLIEERPFWGYGMHGAESLLIDKTLANGILDAKERRYNAHNQFLQSTLDNGLIGIILFIFILWLLFLKRISLDDSRNVWIIIFILLAFLTESMLERIAGVGILGCSLFLLLLPDDSIKNEEQSEPRFLLRPLVVFSFTCFLATLVLMYSDQNRTIDPNDASSYATGKYTIVENNDIPGNPPKELENSSVLMYDSTTIGWLGAHGVYHHVPISYVDVEEYDTIVFTSYCYVSDNYNGTWVRISVDGKNEGKTEIYYDLNKKGTWQKLFLHTICSDGKVSLNLMMAMYESENFDELDGEVLFALPQFKVKPVLVSPLK